MTACVHTPYLQGKPCQTICGMRLYGSNDCSGFQAAENRAVKVYENHLRFTCDRFYGWVVYVQPTDKMDKTWLSPGGRAVLGLTWCRQQTIQVETDNWPLSSLSHELVHAAECGERSAYDDPHEGWDTGWQTGAIDEAK